MVGTKRRNPNRNPNGRGQPSGPSTDSFNYMDTNKASAEPIAARRIGGDKERVVVNMFKPDKGFGFVTTEGFGDAFIHISTVKSFYPTNTSPKKGDELLVRLESGSDNRVKVSRVFEVLSREDEGA